MVINMKKKIVLVVVLTLMVCSFCGAVVDIGEVLSHSTQEWETVMTPDSASLDGEPDPEDGIPGGPPGTPG